MTVNELLEYAKEMHEEFGGSCEIYAMIIDPRHVRGWTKSDDGVMRTTLEEAMEVCSRIANEMTKPESQLLEWIASTRVAEVLAEVRTGGAA